MNIKNKFGNKKFRFKFIFYSVSLIALSAIVIATPLSLIRNLSNDNDYLKQIKFNERDQTLNLVFNTVSAIQKENGAKVALFLVKKNDQQPIIKQLDLKPDQVSYLFNLADLIPNEEYRISQIVQKSNQNTLNIVPKSPFVFVFKNDAKINDLNQLETTKNPVPSATLDPKPTETKPTTDPKPAVQPVKPSVKPVEPIVESTKTPPQLDNKTQEQLNAQTNDVSSLAQMIKTTLTKTDINNIKLTLDFSANATNNNFFQKLENKFPTLYYVIANDQPLIISQTPTVNKQNQELQFHGSEKINKNKTQYQFTLNNLDLNQTYFLQKIVFNDQQQISPKNNSDNTTNSLRAKRSVTNASTNEIIFSTSEQNNLVIEFTLIDKLTVEKNVGSAKVKVHLKKIARDEKNNKTYQLAYKIKKDQEVVGLTQNQLNHQETKFVIAKINDQNKNELEFLLDDLNLNTNYQITDLQQILTNSQSSLMINNHFSLKYNQNIITEGIDLNNEVNNFSSFPFNFDLNAKLVQFNNFNEATLQASFVVNHNFNNSEPLKYKITFSQKINGATTVTEKVYQDFVTTKQTNNQILHTITNSGLNESDNQTLTLKKLEVQKTNNSNSWLTIPDKDNFNNKSVNILSKNSYLRKIDQTIQTDANITNLNNYPAQYITKIGNQSTAIQKLFNDQKVKFDGFFKTKRNLKDVIILRYKVLYHNKEENRSITLDQIPQLIATKNNNQYWSVSANSQGYYFSKYYVASNTLYEDDNYWYSDRLNRDIVFKLTPKNKNQGRYINYLMVYTFNNNDYYGNSQLLPKYLDQNNQTKKINVQSFQRLNKKYVAWTILVNDFVKEFSITFPKGKQSKWTSITHFEISTTKN
ncbi:hypothetical protein MCAV_07350 [[Mycoplasma] cavipharyngis]|uniref:hypothetical protein n=1 Tax=[Mycoplasma] cavipharyngis TaxID=92757 RepID=UPI003703AF4A